MKGTGATIIQKMLDYIIKIVFRNVISLKIFQTLE